MTKKLERVILFRPAYDHRAEDANKPEGQRRGQHNVEAVWLVRGDAGAVQFVLSTGWLKEMVATPDPRMGWGMGFTPHEKRRNGWVMPTDLGYHSHRPHYEGHEPMGDECWAIGETCYYDGSGLNAEEPFSILVNEGGEKLWEFLEGYYRRVFGSEGGDAS